MSVNSCQDVVELITAYLEDALPVADRVEFERHVAICPPCRAYMTQMRRVIRTAGSLREDELPEPVREKLVSAFRDWKTRGNV